jgi:hypothetical protein
MDFFTPQGEKCSKMNKKNPAKLYDLMQSHQLHKMTLWNHIHSSKSLYSVETEKILETNSGKLWKAAAHCHNAASMQFSKVN